MKEPIPCPADAEGRKDLAPLYLAGKLEADEAEAFEAHYFGCANCREDVRIGAALRELHGRPAVTALELPAPARRSWLAMAAAVLIAVGAVAIWQVSRRSVVAPGQPALRGPGAAALALQVKPALPGGTEVSWIRQPQAADYRVEVFAPDGVLVWSAETTEPRLEIAADALPVPGPGQSLVVEVQARDSLGQVIASSEPTSLPPSR